MPNPEIYDNNNQIKKKKKEEPCRDQKTGKKSGTALISNSNSNSNIAEPWILYQPKNHTNIILSLLSGPKPSEFN